MLLRLYPIKAKLENKQYLTVERHRVGNFPNHCNTSRLLDRGFLAALLHANVTHLQQVIAYGDS